MSLPVTASISQHTTGNKEHRGTQRTKKSNALKILDFVKALKKTTTIAEIENALKLKPAVITATLNYLKSKNHVKQTCEDYFTYAGRFVQFDFNTLGETRANSVSRVEVLNGHDAMLGCEELTLTNRTDEEFAVTFNITGIESAELARKSAFIVDQKTDKMVWQLHRETPNILKRPLIEKKAFTFDRLPPGQTKKYCLEFLVDREFMEKAPKNGLTCTLKIDCISLNYHDFAEVSIWLDPTFD